jgi:hypothetical protein
MTLHQCLTCSEPVDTDCGDRCGDCQGIESRHYADWWESEGVANDEWWNAQNVDQTVRADIAETPSDEEVATEVARYFSPPVFIIPLIFADYLTKRAEWNANKTLGT